MLLLLFFVLLFVALGGGTWVNPWLYALLLVALLALVLHLT